jgi:hypothetical protein
MVFKKRQKDANVMTTEEYCKKRGTELRTAYLNTKSFNNDTKRQELIDITRSNEKSALKQIHQYSVINGWEKFALETSDNKLIPVLHLAPANKSLGYVIICNTKGKQGISLASIDDLKKKGIGIVVVDLSGTGEAYSSTDQLTSGKMVLHTMSRAEIWLGRTIIGEWINELNLVTEFLKSKYKAEKITIDGTREAGLAALFFGAQGGDVNEIILRDAPVSYLFDNRESVDFFSMAIHLPGFLKWGDVSLAAALTGKNVSFINPLTMSGQKLGETKLKEFQSEYEKLRVICRQPGKTNFN